MLPSLDGRVHEHFLEQTVEQPQPVDPQHNLGSLSRTTQFWMRPGNTSGSQHLLWAWMSAPLRHHPAKEIGSAHVVKMQKVPLRAVTSEATGTEGETGTKLFA